MTDRTDRGTDAGTATFTVASPAIPVAIRCRPCGRAHFPARLWPRAIHGRPGGRTEVELRCVRCNTLGSLFLDDSDPDHRPLLAMWQDTTAGDDTRAGST